MIKLTLNEARTAALAYPQLPATINAKASHDLSVIRNKLNAHLSVVQEQQRKIIEAHGGAIEPTGVIKWKEGAEQSVADAEFADYLTKEVEINREPVKLSALLIGDDPAKWPQVHPDVLAALEKIIVE